MSSSVTASPSGSYPGDSADTITGNGGNDTIEGRGGDDTIYTGAGSDTAYGGAGNDFFDDFTASSSGGSDSFYGGIGNDTIYGWTGYDSLYGDDGDDFLYGEGDDDILDGGIGADKMYGGQGSDTYYVDNALDVVEDDGEGYGYDRVNASVTFTLGAGVEALTLIGRSDINGTGNSLNNEIAGNDFKNSLFGLGGSDYLYGGIGTDALDGGEGGDRLYGGTGVDTLLGGAGSDRLFGDEGGDALYGGADNDNLYGGAGLDSLEGGDGDDHLSDGDDYNGDAQDGATMNGGAGSDSYYVNSALDTVVETLSQAQGGGIDTVQLGYNVSSFTLGAEVENLYLYYGYYNQTGVGNALANAMFGGYGSDSLYGGDGDDTLTDYYDGNDVLYGGNGADTLDGGYGTDSMYGGANDDTYFVDRTTDLAVETNATGGKDTVNSTATYTLGSYLEDLTLIGSANINGTGNNGGNVLTGTTGVNTLKGLGGADTFRSFSGADILIGGTGADTFQYQGVQGSNPTQRDVIKAGDGAIAFEGAGAAAGDRFDLSLLDADTTKVDIQDFVFGTATGKGRLWATTVGTQTYINGNTDADAAIEFQVAIDDGAVKHTAYTAADFIL